MKKFLVILVLGLSVVLLNSCAKPTVVNVVMPEDENLNCEQLKDGFSETRRFKQEAEVVKEVNTGGNMTRTLLFWPALLQTIHNADLAIRAANDRAYHLIDIMKNKNCDNIDKYFSEIVRTTPSQEIIRLNRLYKMGVLTKEEFEKAFNSESGQTVLAERVLLLHCTTQYPAPIDSINLLAMETLRKEFGLRVGYSDHSEGVTIPIAAAA